MYLSGYVSFRVIEVRRTDAHTRWFQQTSGQAGESSDQYPGETALVGQFRGRSAGRYRGGPRFASTVAPGYRVYFIQRGSCLVVLLGGGDKRSQRRDIARARELALEL